MLPNPSLISNLTSESQSWTLLVTNQVEMRIATDPVPEKAQFPDTGAKNAKYWNPLVFLLAFAAHLKPGNCN